MNRARIRLIVNADDFGFTRGVNEGIVEAHRNGILTATTLMANGDAFDHAVGLARETSSLDIGCHLVLVQGCSVLDAGHQLPATLAQLARVIWRGELPLYEELRAQVRKIVNAGIAPTHLDTHKHTHLFPPVLEAVARVAREFDIEWVRRPFDYGFDRRAKWTRRAISAAIGSMAPGFGGTLARLRATDHFTGFQLTGFLDTGRLVHTIEALPAGLTELMCHPGHLDPDLLAASTRLKESRQVELAALLSPEARSVIARRGIELTSYRSAAV